MINEEQANRVIDELFAHRKPDNRFSSHDFIQEYCRQYEIPYLEWLWENRDSGTPFQLVHTRIGCFLSEHQTSLIHHYQQVGRYKSETIHGTDDYPMWWQFD